MKLNFDVNLRSIIGDLLEIQSSYTVPEQRKPRCTCQFKMSFLSVSPLWAGLEAGSEGNVDAKEGLV